MRRAAKLTLFAGISILTGFAPALAGSYAVPMDEVRIVAFKKPVASVYVGNTVFADATLIDSKHAFVLGKTMGETNIIALGSDGKVISDDHISVFGRRMGMVTLNLGGAQYNYACVPLHCEAQPVPGDEPTYFGNTHNAQQTHETMANNAAAQGGGTVTSTAPAQ